LVTNNNNDNDNDNNNNSASLKILKSPDAQAYWDLPVYADHTCDSVKANRVDARRLGGRLTLCSRNYFRKLSLSEIDKYYAGNIQWHRIDYLRTVIL